MDVKRLGRIPDGGGWRIEGPATLNHRSRCDKTGIGYDFVHTLIDDHSRLAYSEILAAEKGAMCAAFLERAIAYFASQGITDLDRLLTEQCVGVSVLAMQDMRRARRPTEVHSTALPIAERQRRTVQPDSANRVGIRAPVQVER